jgi:hypothetical protein
MNASFSLQVALNENGQSPIPQAEFTDVIEESKKDLNGSKYDPS